MFSCFPYAELNNRFFVENYCNCKKIELNSYGNYLTKLFISHDVLLLVVPSMSIFSKSPKADNTTTLSYDQKKHSWPKFGVCFYTDIPFVLVVGKQEKLLKFWLLTGIQNVVRRQCQYCCCCTWKYSQQSLEKSWRCHLFCHEHMLDKLKKSVSLFTICLKFWVFSVSATRQKFFCSFSVIKKMVMTQFPRDPFSLFLFTASRENAICKKA